MWSRRSLALLVLLALTVVAPRPSAADVKDEARKLAMKGVALLDEGKAAEALSKLEAAEAKFHAPTHLLYMARAQRALGRAQAAHRTYAKILVEKIPNYAPDAFHKAQDDAKAEIVGLENDVATVEIELAGPRAETAEVAIDGEVLGPRLWTVPVAVAPGDHRVSARLGAGEVETTVTAVMGHVVVARLDLSAPPEPPTSTQPLAPEGDSGGFPWVGTTLLALGVGLCFENLLVLIAAVVILLPSHLLTARMEEEHLLGKFPDSYGDYMARVPRFWPRFSGYVSPKNVTVSTRAIRRVLVDTAAVLLIPQIEDLLELLHEHGAIPVIWHFP